VAGSFCAAVRVPDKALIYSPSPSPIKGEGIRCHRSGNATGADAPTLFSLHFVRLADVGQPYPFVEERRSY
jgi:hypothetical protein